MSRGPENEPKRHPGSRPDTLNASFSAKEEIPMGIETDLEAHKAEVRKAIQRLWQAQQIMQSGNVTSANLMELDRAYGELLDTRARRQKPNLLERLKRLRQH